MINKLGWLSLIGAAFAVGHAQADTCNDILPTISEQLASTYVIEQTAHKLANKLSSQTFLKQCQQHTNKAQIAEFITAELNLIANDKHLSLVYDPNWVSELTHYKAGDQELAFADKRNMETPTDNYGFKKVELLDGNIGYLDLRVFSDSHLGGETLENSMKFLQYADAIIIDLRFNFGGSPFMVTSLASYFFDKDTVELTRFESRSNGVVTQSQDWTSPYVPGPRFANTPLYILTSKNSASAAEGFSYAMKNLQRATLIGEVTAGAAHARSANVVNEHFVLTLPTLRPIDPRTNGNWENTGVTPHRLVKSDLALNVAYAEALDKLRNTASNNQVLHQWVYPIVKAKSSQFVATPAHLQSIIGRYGKRKLFLKKEKLYYQYLDDPAYEVHVLDKQLLRFSAFSDARLELVTDENKVTGIKMHTFGQEAKMYAKTGSL